jgi:hypothetical protein
MKNLTKQQIEELNLLISNSKVRKNTNAFKSFVEATETGLTRTGKSSYSKGWSSKSVWTSDVSWILYQLRISHVCLNDAHRGGANGEYIEITDNFLIAKIKKTQKEDKLEAELLKLKEEKLANEKREKLIDFVKSLPPNESFEYSWNSLEMKEKSGLSWSDYRNELKKLNPSGWEILKAKFKTKQDIY